MIPATLVDSTDWCISESLKLAHEKFNSPTPLTSCYELMCSLKFVAMLRRRGPEIILFYGKILLASSEGVPMKSLFIRNIDSLDHQLQRFCEIEILPNKTRTTKKFCVKDTSSSLTHEMKRDITLSKFLGERFTPS